MNILRLIAWIVGVPVVVILGALGAALIVGWWLRRIDAQYCPHSVCLCDICNDYECRKRSRKDALPKTQGGIELLREEMHPGLVWALLFTLILFLAHVAASNKTDCPPDYGVPLYVIVSDIIDSVRHWIGL